MFSIGKIITLAFIIIVLMWLFRAFKSTGNVKNTNTKDGDGIVSLKKGKDGKYR